MHLKGWLWLLQFVGVKQKYISCSSTFGSILSGRCLTKSNSDMSKAALWTFPNLKSSFQKNLGVLAHNNYSNTLTNVHLFYFALTQAN